MSGKATLPDELYQHDFHQLAKTEPHPRTRIRLLAMAHLKDGRSQVDTADALRVNKDSIQEWLKRLKREGLKGLAEKGGRGKTSLLKKDQELAFKEAVIKLQDEREGGRVKGSDIHKLLADQFHIECHLNTVYDYLNRVGLVWITSRSKHPKHSSKAQDAFKKTLK